jgi:hypothetical protein
MKAVTWTKITYADEAVGQLPAWLASRMVGLRGRFGLLLSTGDVMRVGSIAAVHQSSTGTVLLDVMLDHPGVPDGVDLAWLPKHFLGAPVMGAMLATVNLAHVVAAVEFTAADVAELHREIERPANDEVDVDPMDLATEPEAIGAAP